MGNCRRRHTDMQGQAHGERGQWDQHYPRDWRHRVYGAIPPLLERQLGQG